MICIPPIWNHDLVVYAHGYVAYNEPLDFQHLTLPDGTYLPNVIMGLGFAFATTSYRENGLAILTGLEDIRQLTEYFPTFAHRQADHVYLAGPSEGGAVTTLGIERYPALFSGGLAACGPIGDFRGQVSYLGDYRVLFDYFFPGVLPPSPISIPQEVIDNWDSYYEGAVSAAVAGNPDAAKQLIRTSKAAIDPAQPSTLITTTVNALWYNVYATNDAAAKLGGNPYGNPWQWYWGSQNDRQLNRNVQRFVADQAALDALKAYQTSGNLTEPLVTLHTTADEVVPFWHELVYLAKASKYDASQLTPIPIRRYGHCNFTTAEALAAFGLLVLRVTGSQPAGLTMYFSPDQVARDFAQVQQEFANTGQSK
jgi:pimeloyl-ACP methyl ester carboxylesterase